jgi:3-oxosteroid 1-dehydrogenase
MDVDLLVVGSGAGGLTAALTAARAGQRVLVAEKMSTLGGSTALSGGALWIPNNPLMREAGIEDSFDAAWRYLNGLVGDPGPASSPVRKRAFLEEGPEMVEFLLSAGVQLVICDGYPDYYAGRPGGRSGGRSIEPPPFDGRRLGADYARLGQRQLLPWLALRAQDLRGLSNGLRTWSAVRTDAAMVWRTLAGLATGRRPLTMGTALVAQLVLRARDAGVELRTNAPLRRLLTDRDGAVVGAVLGGYREEMEVRAANGVVLATGGFARNAAMRSDHQPVSETTWTSAHPGDEGDGIRAGLVVGAAVAQMEEAWWMPSSKPASGEPVMSAFERSKPGSIIVDASGQRFVNEATSYMEVGQRMIERGDQPCWLILDSRNRRRYPLGSWPAGWTPRRALRRGDIVRADTLAELAQRCRIDETAFEQTVARFNRLCATGRDDDFARGADPYDRYYGDPRVGPNPCLGPIDAPPYYGLALYPGDIGTNGGLLTDEHARVLRDVGDPIPGLYATGNCTASVMGHTYPGAGATIAPSAVFGYIAARHAGAPGPGSAASFAAIWFKPPHATGADP